MPDEIRIVFRRVSARDEPYLNGSGELNFLFNVNGVSVGDIDQDFVVRRRSYIDLDGTWSIIVDVGNLTEVTVRMQMRDADRGIRTDMGSITHTLRAPWLPRNYNSRNQHFSVEWGVEMPSGSQWVREGDNEIFACREHAGSVTYTTVDGRSGEARMEINPVRPTPLPPPLSNLPVRPISPYLLNFDRAVYMGDEPMVIAPGSPLNILPNPPVIPVLAHPTFETAALIEFTYYFPHTLWFHEAPHEEPRRDTTRDERLEWSVVPINGGDVRFLGHQGNKGLRVFVYGRAEGEVRLEVRLRGALVATYRALVAAVRQIPYRVNILNGPTVSSRPPSLPEQILDHFAIANRYLRQVALELIVDSSPQTHNHATPAMFGVAVPGIFNINVPVGLTRNVDGLSSQGQRATILNYLPGVVNFVYIHSSFGGHFNGEQVDGPDHPEGRWIRDNGTPSTSWVKPTGVEPDAAAGTVRMRLLRGNSRLHHQQLYSILIAGNCGNPVTEADVYGLAIAHELGHLLGLGHRNPSEHGEEPTINDLVHFPPTENVMLWVSDSRSQSFDIIQAKAMRASSVVVNHSIIAP